MPLMKKSVLVIGTGPSGLCAVKEMKEAGHDVMAIDKAPDIGGVFRDADDMHYRKMYLTISNFHMAYSDFPPLENDCKYTTKQAYFQYLKAYCDHFDLNKHFKFNTKVVSAELKDCGSWTVKAEDKDGKIMTYTPDTLIVATGSNHTPHAIETPGFTGEVVHASDFRGAAAYKGKRVLLIGSGESGSDISDQLVNGGCTRVALWSRRFALLAPRLLSCANDENEPYYEQKLMEAQNPAMASDLLETITISRVAGWLPPFVYALIRHMLIWNVPKTYKNGDRSRIKLIADWAKAACEGHYLKADQVGAAAKNAFLSVLDAEDRVDTIVAPQARFMGKKVVFPQTQWYNGRLKKPVERSIEVDTILLCTGYKTDFSWLKTPAKLEANPRKWYKQCFPPEMGDKLMFMGWTRPHQGGIPVCAELLSRYAAMVLKGTKMLPKNYAELARKEGELATRYYVQTPHYASMIDYPAFSDSVADLIGCRPKPPSIFNFERFFQYWAYPSWALWFRQRGPGAKPMVIEEILDKVPSNDYWKSDPIFLISVPIAATSVVVNTILTSLPLIGNLFRMPGDTLGWMWFKPRRCVLHGNKLPTPPLWVRAAVWGGIGAGIHMFNPDLYPQMMQYAAGHLNSMKTTKA